MVGARIEPVLGAQILGEGADAHEPFRALAVKILAEQRKDFEHTSYPGEPHGFRKPENRIDMYQRLETFFDGSPAKTMQALVDLSRDRGDEIDWDEMERLVQLARKEGR